MGIHEIKKSTNKEYIKNCSLCFIFWCKYMWSSNDSIVKEEIVLLCNNLITDWYNKRNLTNVSLFFYDIISRNLCMARILLTSSLIKATLNGRTSYIKSESFHLLSILHHHRNNNENNKDNNVYKESIRILQSCIPSTIASLHETYNKNDDKEMLNAKRLNNVLKLNTNLMQFIIANNDSFSTWKDMNKIKKGLNSIQMNSNSLSIKNKCNNIMQLLEKEEEEKGSNNNKFASKNNNSEKKKKDSNMNQKNDDKKGGKKKENKRKV